MMNKKEQYFEWKDFENFCLEESWILKIKNYTNKIVFEIEAVLLESHPDYVKPKNSEKYTYLRKELIFQDISYLEWKHINLKPSIDANIEYDYGHVDTLYRYNNIYYLNGDIGELKIICRDLIIL